MRKRKNKNKMNLENKKEWKIGKEEWENNWEIKFGGKYKLHF